MTCTSDPALCFERQLDAYGSIQLPSGARVTLAGESAADAARLIASRAGVSRRSLGLELLSSPDAPVEYRGALLKPGSVRVYPGFKLRDLLALAQPDEAGDLERVVIETAQRERLIVNSKEQNPDIRPGDLVLVPLANVANEVLVVGGVNKPGSIKHRDGITVRQAIAEAGGLSPHGQEDAIRVSRGEELIALINFREASQDAVLRRGDVIQVPLVKDRLFISVSGWVKRPGLVPFREGMTLMEVIDAAGGLTQGAAVNAIEVRLVGQRARRYDLSKAVLRGAGDVKLKSNEIVHVPVFVPKPKKESDGKFRPVVPPL